MTLLSIQHNLIDVGFETHISDGQLSVSGLNTSEFMSATSRTSVLLKKVVIKQHDNLFRLSFELNTDVVLGTILAFSVATCSLLSIHPLSIDESKKFIVAASACVLMLFLLV